MTICSQCKEHVQRRSKIAEGKIISYVNIPKKDLQTMSLDDLTEIYNMAKEGMVCKDCKKLCDYNDSTCTSADRQNMPAYLHRAKEDQATMQNILQELDKRINLKRAAEDLKKYK